nr:hypothetical protein [Tanacetum cinerariifolium]
MQALKESRKFSRRQPGTGGSDEGTGSMPGVLDESTVIFTTSREGTGAKPGVLIEEKDIIEEKVILEWGDEQDSEHFDDDKDDDAMKDDKDGDADDEGVEHISDAQDADDEDDETESDKEEIYKYKISVRKDKDEEMKESKVAESKKGEEEVINAANNDAEKTLETKRRRTKEFESSKKPSSTKQTSKGKAPTKGSKTGKSALVEEPFEEPIAEVVMDDAGDDVARDDNQPQDTSEPKRERLQIQNDGLCYKVCSHLQRPNGNTYRLLQVHVEWTQDRKSHSRYPVRSCLQSVKRHKNPEGDRYSFDLSKSLPLQGPLSHQTVAFDFFFNKDLEYLKTSDLEVTYTTSITKTNVAQYDIIGIEDMVPTIWSPIKFGYDKDVLIGIKHWGKRRKLWYRSQVNKFSKHNVYSAKIIHGLKSVKVVKLHGYGHLDKIVVKRFDQQFYTFKKGEFVDLHLNDIEDMFLLTVQHKLFHLDKSDTVDFIVALRMFTRSLVIKKSVEDLQLGVESYQKKLNITKP